LIERDIVIDDDGIVGCGWNTRRTPDGRVAPAAIRNGNAGTHLCGKGKGREQQDEQEA
jgi:hypothetical protein